MNSAVFKTPLTKEKGILAETMMPYIEGTESYDTCLKKLEERLEDYISGDKTAIKYVEPKECITVVYENEGMGKYHPYYDWWKEAAAALEKEGIHVSLVGEWDGTLSSFVGQLQDIGIAPDVLIDQDGNLRVALVNDTLPQYTELYQDAKKEQYAVGALESFLLNGQLYALPFSVRTPGLWYNKEILEQTAVDWKEVETWEDLTELLRQLKALAPKSTPLMISNSGTIMQQLLWYGGACTTQENKKIQLNEKQALETIQWLQEMGKEGLVSCATDIEIAELFREGTCAVCFGDSDFLNYFEPDGTVPWVEYQIKTGFHSFPVLRKDIERRNLVTAGELFYLPSGGNKEAALRFVQACMESDTYGKVISAENRMPLRTNLLTEEEIESVEDIAFRIDSYDDLERVMNLALQGKSDTEKLYGICEKAFTQ